MDKDTKTELDYLLPDKAYEIAEQCIAATCNQTLGTSSGNRKITQTEIVGYDFYCFLFGISKKRTYLRHVDKRKWSSGW